MYLPFIESEELMSGEMTRLLTIVPELIMLFLWPLLMIAILAWGAWLASLTRIPRVLGRFGAEVAKGYQDSMSSGQHPKKPN